jgi:hypothetical protein
MCVACSHITAYLSVSVLTLTYVFGKNSPLITVRRGGVGAIIFGLCKARHVDVLFCAERLFLQPHNALKPPHPTHTCLFSLFSTGFSIGWSGESAATMFRNSLKMLLTGGKANRKSRGSGESDRTDNWIFSADDQLFRGLCFVGPGVSKP